MKTPLKHSWEQYERMVISPDAGEIQRKVMRESYYAGAFMVYSLVYGTSNDREEKLRAMFPEFQAFAEEVEKAREQKTYDA